MNWSVVVVAVIIVAAGLAFAAPPAAAEDRAAAEQLFRIGAAAYKAGKFDAAASQFDRAYELFPAPEIAFSAAQAHRLQYQADREPVHVKRAIELFEAYVAGAPAGGKRRDALAHLERLRDVLAKLEAAGARVTAAPAERPSIYVSVAIDGALITVDGKAVDRYTSIEVAPGEHTIAVSADGYFGDERKVTVAKGQAMVPIELRPRPALVAIHSARDARVLVDGRPVAAGAAGVEVAAGTRLVTVYARGRQPVTRELELAPGQELSLDVPLRATTRRRLVKWVAAGTGALAATTIACAGVALAADFSAADLRDASEPLDSGEAARYQRLRDRRDRLRAIGAVTGGATAAAAAVALWMYYGDTPSPDELARPGPRERPGGFAPIAITGGGLGVGYAGGW